MTALSEYERLEATGLWRAGPDVQRREVIVSIGDATLMITDHNDIALAHWSLAAVARANPGTFPAIYHPDGDPGETLELAADEGQMIEAIEKLRSAIERRRPHPGRLRTVLVLGSVVLGIMLAIFWFPGAVVRHTVSVVPSVKRAEIGEALLTRIQRVSGLPCDDPLGGPALQRLAARLPAPTGTGQLVVLRGGVRDTAHLPGGIILINRALIEDFEEPDVVAGYVIAERLRMQLRDPLEQLLSSNSLLVSLRLLTTGKLNEATLTEYSERLLTEPKHFVDDETLLAGFKAWEIRSTPYAYAVDVSGETTLSLIEADPFSDTETPPIMTDGDWLRLQNICGG